MKKRSFFLATLIVLSLSLVVGMIPVATSAAEVSNALTSALTFSVDYRSGSAEDQTGNFTISEDGSDDPTFVDDATLGSKAARFGGDGSAALVYEDGYDFSAYDLNDGLTVEMYLFMDEGFDGKETNFFAIGANAVCLSDYNTAGDQANGFRCTQNNDPQWTTDPSTSMCNAYVQDHMAHGAWTHIVGVSDGEYNYYYVNGTEVAKSEARVSNNLHPQTVSSEIGATITIGDGGASIWPALLEGEIAYARVYLYPASQADITALYANVGGTVDPGPADVATPTPTPEPTPEPVVVDSAKIDAAIKKAEGLNKDDYTAETYDAVQTALMAAKNAKNNPVSQEDTDAKAEALETAIANLKGNFNILWVILPILGVVIVGAAVAIVLILLKKKKAGGNGPQAPQGPAAPQGPQGGLGPQGITPNAPQMPPRPQGAPVPPRPQGAPMPPRPQGAPMPPRPQAPQK